MKELKAFLRNQKDLSMTMWVNELEKGKDANLVLTAYWNQRVIHVSQMLKELEDGKK